MMSDHFSSGSIYLIRKAISGRYGIPRILSMLLGGIFGIPYLEEKNKEIYLVLFTSNKKIMLVFHADLLGYDLSKRRINNGKFQIDLEDTFNPKKITRDQLKRLLIDGTYQGEWRDDSLRKQFEEYSRACCLPNPEEKV